ncbi:MAG TPA: hypothetical protein VF597_04510 [Candidatus Saccharimonadales bacterium]
MKPFPSDVENAHALRVNQDADRRRRQRDKEERKELRKQQRERQRAYPYLNAKLRAGIKVAIRVATKQYESGGHPFADVTLTARMEKSWVWLTPELKLKLAQELAAYAPDWQIHLLDDVTDPSVSSREGWLSRVRLHRAGIRCHYCSRG